MKEAKLLAVACLVLTLSSGKVWAAEPHDDKVPPVAAENSPPARSGIVGARAESRAKDTEKQATEAESQGKALIAKRLLALSQIWRRVAEAERQAAEVERKVRELESKSLTLQDQSRRAAALIEQTEARRARALGRLQQLGLSDASPQTKASPEVAEQPSEKSK